MNKIIQSLAQHAESHPFTPAIVSEYAVITYQELNILVIKTASWLLSQGIKSGDNVGTHFSDSIANMICALSLMKIGAAQGSLALSDTEIILKEKVKSWNLNHIVCDRKLLDSGIPTHRLNSQVFQTVQVLNEFPSFDENQTCLLLYGSGTTGKPKLFNVSFKKFDLLIKKFLEVSNLNAGERYLSVIEIAFFAGMFRIFSCVTKGASTVFHQNKQKPVSQCIDELAVDHASLAVVHAKTLLEAVEHNKIDGIRFPRLKTITVTGSTVNTALRNDIISRLNPNLVIVYGTNETAGITVAGPDLIAKYPNTVGTLYPDTELQIVDDDDCILECNQIGHIRARTEGMIAQYNHQDAESPIKDGWFYTNDMGYVNEEGALFLKGRADDLIIFEGVNIYPKEIEEMLESNPLIKEAAAYPVEKPDGEIIPAATVSLKAKEKASDLEILKKFSRDQMGWKHPRQIEIIEEFPRNTRGKILKRELKAKIEDKLNRQ